MVTFDRDEIIDALNELLDVLAGVEAHSHIRIVGGAALAVRFGRDGTTTAVDALYGAAPEVEDAVRQIARRRGWPDNWLNDKVKMFASHFDSPDDWTDFALRDDVFIRVAGAPLLLAMKLRAARGRRDSADIDLLLDACGVTTTAEAVASSSATTPKTPCRTAPARSSLRASLSDSELAALAAGDEVDEDAATAKSAQIAGSACVLGAASRPCREQSVRARFRGDGWLAVRWPPRWACVARRTVLQAGRDPRGEKERHRAGQRVDGTPRHDLLEVLA